MERLVAAKRKGEEVVGEAEPPQATNVVDLMDALSRSVEESRSRGRGKGGARPGRKKREDLTSLSKAELYERASAAGVPGRSKMTRRQLIEALSQQTAAA
ncbi:Rho termination factor N-terminal domain-containing protein [Streptomyces sp. NPDC040750]|uniref:Rho termination factor N-terminal domain-containing protein n=1 Tax=Streptomyces sp. NPDC040750 TaxID=3154491 RepID=UPI0033D91E5B